MTRSKHLTSRRTFLRTSAAVAASAVAAPMIIPASALGKDGAVAPSNRIVFGCIGLGGQGRHNMGQFLGRDDCQVVALCDVDTNHRKAALTQVAGKYKSEAGIGLYTDFRELVARKDIDAVTVCTPDHWHALASIGAANNGKDIYCEKPLSNSVAEGRAIVTAVEKNQRVLQTGSHERSGASSRFGCELVRNGRIGKLKTIRVNLPCSDHHHQQAMKLLTVPSEQPVPAHFDYDMWLGHTAKAPYVDRRCHFWWRFVLAYGGGEITDRGAHVIDIGQLGGGFDATSLVEIKATGKRNAVSLYDAFWEYEFAGKYANGVEFIGSSSGARGVKFEGTDGWIFIHIHGGKLEASDPAILKEKIGEKEIQLGRSPGHHQDFINAIRSRKQPIAGPEIGHRTATLCHLINIAMLTGKPLTFDPASEKITNDAQANAMLSPVMRAPWSI